MRKMGLSALVTTFVLLAGAGCNSKEAPAPASAAPVVPAAAPESAAAYATNNSPTEVITAARTLLKSGNVEEAAAHLASLQLQGASFSAQQAKDYRQALSEAYDRAIEGVQRGDPKAQAALQLLRAAGPR